MAQKVGPGIVFLILWAISNFFTLWFTETVGMGIRTGLLSTPIIGFILAVLAYRVLTSLWEPEDLFMLMCLVGLTLVLLYVHLQENLGWDMSFLDPNSDCYSGFCMLIINMFVGSSTGIVV